MFRFLAAFALLATLGVTPPSIVRVGTLLTDGASVIFYAKERGYFQRNGLDVDIQTLPSAATIVAVVAGGDLDIGVADVATVAQARTRGIPLRFIAPGAVAGGAMLGGWFALDRWIVAQPDTVARFASALRAAAQWANAHHAETAAILARDTGIPAPADATVTRAQFGLALDPALIRPVLDAAVRNGELDHPVNVNDLIWHR
ncbi:MAG TPA: ABC transporter substrate-binding protein [Candidatus Lustribacter sp.]|jgi:ABC-type nitrate/sulfonate/bicarbonate transport system substrate-binding protein|nr:ABC transporter substrate-binding protein [Candidatus Lustribacter sp.]